MATSNNKPGQDEADEGASRLPSHCSRRRNWLPWSAQPLCCALRW